MADGADLQIHLLGELKLLSRGRALVLPPSKKTRALLAFLVATGRPHLRESLCDLLWEGPDDPRGALRWSLAKLRPLLDGEHATRLVTDRERVAFASNRADVDVVTLSTFSSQGVSKATTEQLKTQQISFRASLPKVSTCRHAFASANGARQSARSGPHSV